MGQAPKMTGLLETDRPSQVSVKIMEKMSYLSEDQTATNII